jgi:toxin-antitoxin system PIN domain toxin
MILVDANLLLYATIEDYRQHPAARMWLEGRLNGKERVGLPWESLLAFCRIATNPRLFRCPLSVDMAWSQVVRWLEVPVVWIPLPTDRHASLLGRLLITANAAANLVPDAHLAALAMEHGLVLCSTDEDYKRFKGLNFENPLRP